MSKLTRFYENSPTDQLWIPSKYRYQNYLTSFILASPSTSVSGGDVDNSIQISEGHGLTSDTVSDSIYDAEV